MSTLAVMAVGADRPGIIARLTGVIAERGGNLEDCSMTVLSGHFAIMLVITGDIDAQELEQALTVAAEDLDLAVTVRSVGEGDRPRPPTHVLSVYGGDRPGIVHEITSVLAAADVNVTDLTTRVIEGESTVYAMALEITVPVDLDESELRQSVVQGTRGLEVTLHPIDSSVL